MKITENEIVINSVFNKIKVAKFKEVEIIEIGKERIKNGIRGPIKKVAIITNEGAIEFDICRFNQRVVEESFYKYVKSLWI